MSPDDLDEWLKRSPFEPFRMKLSTGDVFAVHHPDEVWVGDTRATVVAHDSMRPDRTVDVSYLHIVTIETLPPPIDLAKLVARAKP